nr:hypothetical protein RTCK_00512 [Rhizobium sp. TCK]
MTHLHGPVPLSNSVYAVRPFETELAREIQAGRWVLLLGPRQHGKTSALLRLQKTLSDNGMRIVLVDLQKTPPFETYASLVTWFARLISKGLGGGEVSESDDLSALLTEALPKGNFPVIVIVDEASNIQNDGWRNSFYGQLRAISSERAVVGADHIASRLRFIFAGTFRHEKLVAEANSPFNICQRVDSTDLVLDDVVNLAAEAGSKTPCEVADLIHDAVGGQPFLVQKLLDEIVGVDDELEQLRLSLGKLREGTSDHISNLFRRVISDDGLASVVTRVVTSGATAATAGDDDQNYLTVLGILKRDKGALVFRNKLYAEVASNSPQLASPEVAATPKSVLFPIGHEQFLKVRSSELREIAYSAQNGAIAAYRGNSNRLALAGIGTALEAVLLDFVHSQSPTDIIAASAECRQKGRHFKDSDPSTWTLADLMRAARKLLAASQLDLPENLREWRNLIHPAVALQSYKVDDELSAEVGAAASLLRIVLRDMP